MINNEMDEEKPEKFETEIISQNKIRELEYMLYRLRLKEAILNNEFVHYRRKESRLLREIDIFEENLQLKAKIKELEKKLKDK